METFATFLDALATRYGPRQAFAFAPHERVVARMTWAELRHASRVAERQLLNVGVTKGARVGLLCSNCIEWLVTAFGALRMGALLVPLSTLSTRDDLAHALTHADVYTLIMQPAFRTHDYLVALNSIVPEFSDAAPGMLFSRHAPMLRRVLFLDGR